MNLLSCTSFLTRWRIVRIVVQEQSLQTDLCGVSGHGCPFCCFLSDLPQYPRWCTCCLQYHHPKDAISNSKVDSQGRFNSSTTKEAGPFNNVNCIFSLSASIALLCSFLLGLGDSCFNTQLYSILGSIYAEQSTPAFAIFKFIQVSPDSYSNCQTTFWAQPS